MRLHHSDVGEEAVVGGVVHRNAGLGAEIDNVLQFELLGGNVHETVLVTKENQSKDPPHVVDEIRVVELHAPAFGLRWKTPKHQHFCINRQERLERVPLDGRQVGIRKQLGR